MNGLSSFDKLTSNIHQLAAGDLIRFWRSKVKVTAGHRGHILRTLYLMNYLSNLDETYRE